MGIRGLKSFIENNSDLKTRHELHDSYLVIDGSNLIYSLYWKSSITSKDYLYGGDYNRFGETVRQFFKTLQKCGIEAIVVLDGGIDPSQQKFKKIIERFRKNLQEAKNISRGNLCNDKIIGSLCKPVFLEVCSLLGVRHIQASFEADSFVAQIANQLHSPVLSNDSDFFVFDLNSGVISVDCLMYSLDVKKYCHPNDSSQDYRYLDCDLFLIDNLIEYFPGLKREVLPLFSTLMGNDWVDPFVFDNVFNAIPDVPTVSRKKSKSLHASKRQKQMIKLLNWLRNKTIEESVDFLINFLKKNRRNNALELLQISLQIYSEGLSQHNHSLDLTNLSSFLPNKDPTLPEWFVDEFHRSLMSTALMNVIKMKCEVFSPRVEDFSFTSSSYTTAIELRQYLFALLRDSDEDIQPIKIFDRIGTQLSTYSLQPKPLTPNGLNILPIFHKIRAISITERRALFSDILSIDENVLLRIQTFFESNRPGNDMNGGVFLVVILRYWMSKVNHQIWIEFIYSMITSIIFCGYVGSFGNIRYFSLPKEEIKEALNNLNVYNSRPQHNGAKLYEPRIAHFYNELQDCLKIIRSMNLLFGCPFQMGTPFFCLNGLFIYNLTVELSSRRDPVLYLSLLFGRQSFATNLFQNLLDLTIDGIDSQNLIRCLKVTNRKTHLKSQQIRTKRTPSKPSAPLVNRFAALKIE